MNGNLTWRDETGEIVTKATKLRYVGGGVTIITSKGVEYINLEDTARSKVRDLLGNERWDTKCSY